MTTAMPTSGFVASMYPTEKVVRGLVHRVSTSKKSVKILQVHNFYQQPGGEDLVVADEARLLEARGHEVVRHTVHNDQVSSLSSLSLGQRTIWSQPAYRDVRAAIARHQPQLVHVHNTLPLLSPSVYYAASAERVPVVQTLHNYRLTCPAALCFRSGLPCTECVGSVHSMASDSSRLLS